MEIIFANLTQEQIDQIVVRNNNHRAARSFGSMDDQGRRQGAWQTYRHGKLYEQAFYNDDLLQGVVKNWYANNQLRAEIPYDKGAEQGLVQSWHANGQLCEKINYQKGKMSGHAESWYQNGQQRRDAYYLDGNLHGVTKKWDENGHLASVKFKQNGRTVIDCGPELSYMKFWDSAKAMLGINRRDVETLAADQYKKLAKRHPELRV